MFESNRKRAHTSVGIGCCSQYEAQRAVNTSCCDPVTSHRHGAANERFRGAAPSAHRREQRPTSHLHAAAERRAPARLTPRATPAYLLRSGAGCRLVKSQAGFVPGASKEARGGVCPEAGEHTLGVWLMALPDRAARMTAAPRGAR
eukprot:354869-Chlamydomonas_euryale.AAC.10